MTKVSLGQVPHPPTALIERLKALSVATLSDCLEAPVLMAPALQPLRPDWRLVGPARTVEVPPGDNLLTHLALAHLQPGEVLVLAITRGVVQPDPPRALLGGLMVATATRLQAAGLVIDGQVRDCPEIAAGPLPVFARGASPLKPTKNGPGRINQPVRCGGVTVAAGDIIIGDRDGVLVVPATEIEALVEKAEALAASEAERMRAITQGPLAGLKPGWLDATLRARGLEVDEAGA